MRHPFFLVFSIKIAAVSLVFPVSMLALFVCMLVLDGMAGWCFNKCSTFIVCVLDSTSRIWDIFFLKILLLSWVVMFALLMWSGRDVWKDKFNSR